MNANWTNKLTDCGVDIVDDGRKASVVVRWHSTDALIAARDAAGEGSGRRYHSSAWAGSWKTTRKHLAEGRGDERAAELIRSKAARMTGDVTCEMRWQNSVAGCTPNVPAFLAGSPRSMRRRAPRPDACAPIRVWLPVTCSGSLDSHTYTEVFAEVCAALMAMRTQRPVELRFYTHLNCTLERGEGVRPATGCYFDWQADLQSEDYSKLAAWCSIAIGRALAMEICYSIGSGFTGGWAHREAPHSAEAMATLRCALGATESDVVMPPLYDGGHARASASTVKEQLAQAAAAVGLTMQW